MDLELSLGAAPARPLKNPGGGGGRPSAGLKLKFCREEQENEAGEAHRDMEEEEERRGSPDPPAQLNLLLPADQPTGFSRQMENPNSPASSGGGEEEENGGGRKKLRLSKEQSAFLEENFKEHSSLKPKQKSALAKQLNLRPRQVEVWFQNRRARTKLKQTEVDCEYLKRCCEALTEENRRLHKELSELRALKASHPFYAHLPATTLSMCAACERASKSAGGGGGGGGAITASAGATALFAKTRFHHFKNPPPDPANQPSAAS